MKRKQQILAGGLLLAVFGVGAVAVATGSISFGTGDSATRAVLSEAQTKADQRTGNGLLERLTRPNSTSTAQTAPVPAPVPAPVAASGTPATAPSTPAAAPEPVRTAVIPAAEPAPTLSPGAGPVTVQTTEAVPTVTPGAGSPPPDASAAPQPLPAFVPTSGPMSDKPVKRVLLRSVASPNMCK